LKAKIKKKSTRREDGMAGETARHRKTEFTGYSIASGARHIERNETTSKERCKRRGGGGKAEYQKERDGLK